jgi:hypothetical protein
MWLVYTGIVGGYWEGVWQGNSDNQGQVGHKCRAFGEAANIQEEGAKEYTWQLKLTLQMTWNGNF